MLSWFANVDNFKNERVCAYGGVSSLLLYFYYYIHLTLKCDNSKAFWIENEVKLELIFDCDKKIIIFFQFCVILTFEGMYGR